MNEEKRVLAVDYGTKRIGLAVSDPLGITAQPLKVLENRGKRQDVAAIVTLLSELPIATIVVGLPLRLDGSEGGIEKRVRKFAHLLELESGLPVVLQDERFSSSEAEDALAEGGVPGSERKKVVDRMAAQIILQRYLDSKG